MQSAFVDIGLERDAFLYVSDFMELEKRMKIWMSIPTNRPVASEAGGNPSRQALAMHCNTPER